ncbi:sensor histidine kinase [Isoptericola sp. BMS4]|uniref:sensor histidine kinase n=1 Tax=Isoptericola sp. BMS4 TaxID=2527875 RepID=UPI0014218172|nr:histidine kinase [Isoptericola sp. BMS4]
MTTDRPRDAVRARREAPAGGDARSVGAIAQAVARPWRGDDRRSDLFNAGTLFVIGWVLLQVGLVDTFTWDPPLVGDPQPWWRVALLAVACALTLAKRTHPMLALAAVLVPLAVDVAWGGSLAMMLVLWDLLYGAAMWSGRTAQRWLWGVNATLTIVGAVAVGEATRDVRGFVNGGLLLGAVLLMPMWWAQNVRQKSELAELERARADEAAHAAELERERAADLTRLAELDRHEAVQAERAAMARDLHDVIASHLSTIAIHSGAALAVPPDDDGQGASRDRAALEQVRASAVTSLTEMRAMIDLLRADAPRDALAAPGRLDRLADLVDAARSAGGDVDLLDPDRVVAVPLPAAVSQALHRIATEALTNARKHAAGAPAVVRLAWDPTPTEAVRLEVRNDPPDGEPPVAPDPPLSAGTGLLTMRERAEGVGGTFDAGPTPDGGWVVRAVVPAEGGER